MKYVVKQAAEAVAEKPVELSINVDGDGWAVIKANGSALLAILPRGIVEVMHLTSEDRALGFVADTDDRLKVRNRAPC